jgi:hypothetical protein
MFKSKSITRLLSVFFLGLVFAVAASCSGGGSSSSTADTAAGTGRVALLVTDAPSDIFEEINITVVKAELLSEDEDDEDEENGRVTIFEGEGADARTFNLLDLTDVRIFAIREGVPAGSYSKIRLTLTEVELVDNMGTDDPADDEYFYPSLPGNGKLDLNPRGDFDVVAGGTLAIQIDIDAEKSIHIVKQGNKDVYNFRPVVFIDIITDGFEERFIKLHGDIEDIDTTDESFKLCNTDIPVQIDEDEVNEDSRGCVRVETDGTTSIFGGDGMPATFANLGDYKEATVFGHLMREDDDDDDADKNAGTVAAKDDDDDDNEVEERELDDLVLKAALIELGPEAGFRKLDGTATSTVDSSDQFDMDVEPGQGLATPLSIKVQIQDGTMLINLQGLPVDRADIDTGKLVNVRGVLDVDNKILLASQVMVDTESTTQLVGTVGANPDASCGFTLMTASGDRSVSTDSNTNAYLVTASSSTPIGVNELTQNQQADVYGEAATNGCFEAETIIAY